MRLVREEVVVVVVEGHVRRGTGGDGGLGGPNPISPPLPLGPAWPWLQVAAADGGGVVVACGESWSESKITVVQYTTHD